MLFVIFVFWISYYMDSPYLGNTRGRKQRKNIFSDPSGNQIRAQNNLTIVSSQAYFNGNQEKDLFRMVRFKHLKIVLRGDLNVNRNFQPKLLTSASTKREGELILSLQSLSFAVIPIGDNRIALMILLSQGYSIRQRRVIQAPREWLTNIIFLCPQKLIIFTSPYTQNQLILSSSISAYQFFMPIPMPLTSHATILPFSKK